jgi:hypothetical protein
MRLLSDVRIGPMSLPLFIFNAAGADDGKRSISAWIDFLSCPCFESPLPEGMSVHRLKRGAKGGQTARHTPWGTILRRKQFHFPERSFFTISALSNCIAKAGSTPLGQATEQAPANSQSQTSSSLSTISSLLLPSSSLESAKYL